MDSAGIQSCIYLIKLHITLFILNLSDGNSLFLSGREQGRFF